MKENKMGVMPVRRLIISMSLPMMFSMLVQALYNIVDSIFVSRISESALTAVTLAFPMQNLMIAVGAGTGVGINALLSKSLGEKDFDKSDGAANTGLLLAFLSFLLFLLLGAFGAGPFIRTQTSNPEIADAACSYLQIVCCMSLGLFYQVTFERLLQSTGRTFQSMISQMTGAIINIIFDPIMIFGYFGLPAMGVSGAALATVLGQTVAAFIGLSLNLKQNPEIHLSIRRIFHPSGEIFGRIYFVGVPSILMMSVGSFMNYLMNRILIGFSETATAVFGVYFRLQSFFFMPIFGLNNGLIPVLAFNYGAKSRKRIDEALRFSLLLAFCVMSCGTLIFEFFPRQLLLLFNASEDMMGIGSIAMRIIALNFPLAAVGIILGSVFQAFSRSYYSLIIGLCRQLVILIPAAWLIARITGNVNMVWWSFPISEVISAVLSLFFFRKVYRDVTSSL